MVSARATMSGLGAPGSYRLSFLVGGLLADAAAVAAPIYLQHRDWAATRALIQDGNLLHARTQATGVRVARELVQRMECLSEDEVRHVATAPSTDRAHLMWAAFCRRYALVAEFAEEVLHGRAVFGAGRLVPEDFERFWLAKALWHQELDQVKPSTRRKLRTNLFLAMREAGFLAPDGQVVPPLFSSTVTGLLNVRHPSDLRFFPMTGGA